MWTCPKCTKKVDDAFEICWACGTSVDGIEDPHFLEEAVWEKPTPSGPEAEATPENLVTLIKCVGAGQAHAIRVRLESEGIPVFLFDEFTISMDWLLSNAIGGVKVQVPEPYLERARNVLGIVEEEEEHEEEPEDEEFDDGEQTIDDDQEESDAPAEERIVDKEADQGVTDKTNE
ncbi:MAG: DUF2007 domain-containing protein [Gemmataceae bacterium]|nr:DUF2007 domain-containing protein [Gemmataceae bacterium]